MGRPQGEVRVELDGKKEREERKDRWFGTSLMFSNAPCELMKGTVGQIGTVTLVAMGQERSGMH